MTVVIQDINIDVFVWLVPLPHTDDCHLALFPQRTLAIDTMHQKLPLNKRMERCFVLCLSCVRKLFVPPLPKGWEACRANPVSSLASG